MTTEKWWEDLSPQEQKSYLDTHPHSKKHRTYSPSLLFALHHAPELNKAVKEAVKTSNKHKTISRAKTQVGDNDAKELEKLVKGGHAVLPKRKPRNQVAEEDHEIHEEVLDDIDPQDNIVNYDKPDLTDDIKDEAVEQLEHEMEADPDNVEGLMPSRKAYKAWKLSKKILLAVGYAAAATTIAFSAHPLVFAYLATDLHHAMAGDVLVASMWRFIREEHKDPYDAAYEAILRNLRYPSDDELTNRVKQLKD